MKPSARQGLHRWQRLGAVRASARTLAGGVPQLTKLRSETEVAPHTVA